MEHGMKYDTLAVRRGMVSSVHSPLLPQTKDLLKLHQSIVSAYAMRMWL